MNSRVLKNEIKIDISKNQKLFYGTEPNGQYDIVSVTMKGKYKPVGEKKDYTDDIPNMKYNIIYIVSDFLNKLAEDNVIEKHHIFAFDITEKGVTKGRRYKFKYTLYYRVKKEETVEEHEPLVTIIANGITKLIDCAMSNVNIELLE